MLLKNFNLSTYISNVYNQHDSKHDIDLNCILQNFNSHLLQNIIKNNQAY